MPMLLGMQWLSEFSNLLWSSAWAVIPLVLLVAMICRWMPCRPVTRHTLWVIVLAAFLAPLLSLVVPLPNLLPAVEILSEVEEEILTTAPAASNDQLATRVTELEQAVNESLALVIARMEAQAELVDEAGKPIAAAFPSPITIKEPANPPGEVLVQTTAPPPQTDANKWTVAVPVDSELEKTSPSTWSRWGLALAQVRDALAGLPTLPVSFWIVGLLGMTVYYVGGTARFRGKLAKAEPAPRPVRRMVSKIAREFGLRRIPDISMLSEPISPMIWCGRRSRLVLPTKLWSQLDKVGRQAILCHELAHLRRRDHWVRWVELGISTLFWWNPLVWWVRRRVHEEADLCCDTWVTWLMPRRRRAYAEALLAAREHISAGYKATPAVAMGVTTSGAKRFARRITMVMTQSTRPGISLSGIGLALTLALAGWITTPAWSLPPKEKCEKVAKTAKVVVTDDANVVCCPEAATKCDKRVLKLNSKGDVICDLKCDAKCGDAKKSICKTIVIGDGDEDETKAFSFMLDGTDLEIIGDQPEAHKLMKILHGSGQQSNAIGTYYAMLGDDADDHQDAARYFYVQAQHDEGDLNERLAKLEKAVQRLNQLLGHKTLDIKVPTPPIPPTPPTLPKFKAHAGTGYFKIGDDDDSFAITIPEPWTTHDDGKVEARLYKLPEGKLAALTELMVRQDVPVLVSPKKDGIEVHATPAQHKIFEAFVNLIHPTKKTKKIRHKAGTAPHVYSFSGDATATVDVHKLLKDTNIEIEGIDLDKILESADIALDCKNDAVRVPKIEVKVLTDQLEALEDLKDLDIAEHLEGLEGLEELKELDVLVEVNDDLAKQIDAISKQMEKFEQHAEQIEIQAEEMRDKAESISEESPREARQLRRAARELDRQARQLEAKARRLEQKAERIEDKASEL